MGLTELSPLTVLVDVVVGGDVIEEVLTVGDQAPVIRSAVIIHRGAGVGRQPDFLLADQVLGLGHREAAHHHGQQEGEEHCGGQPGLKERAVIIFLILLITAKPAKLNSLISLSEQKSAKAK